MLQKRLNRLNRIYVHRLYARFLIKWVQSFYYLTMKGLDTVESLSAGAAWDLKFLPLDYLHFFAITHSNIDYH